MARLIINADDYGLCDSVNKGILHCLEEGIITDFSFLINKPFFRNSADLLKEKQISNIGIHLNLTMGESLQGKNSSLANSEGRLPSTGEYFKKFLTRKLDKKALHHEIEMQIDAFLKEGFQITHIDSHQNVHLIPTIHNLIVKILKERGMNIPLRFPYEKLSLKEGYTRSNLKRIFILNTLSLGFIRTNNKKTKVITIGGNYYNNPSANTTLQHVFEKLDNNQSSVYEIAVHPGYFSKEILKFDPYGRERETEIENLKRAFSDKSRFTNLQLVSFKDIQPD